MKKRGRRYVLLVCLVCISSCFGQIKPIENYFTKANNRGKTVKHYIRYGSFDIWEHFHMSEVYYLRIKDYQKRGYITVLVTVLNGNRETLGTIIDHDLAQQKKEWSRHTYPYKKIEKIKKLAIHGNHAELVHYESSRKKRGSRGFDRSIRLFEICYIVVPGNKVLKIKLDSFVNLYEPVKHLWKEFYTSFRTDYSQEYWTNYGSFKLVDNIKEDNSDIEFGIPKADYKLSIGYLDKEQVQKARVSPPIPLPVKFLGSGYFEGVEINKKTEETLIVDGKHAQYYEYEFVDNKKDRSRIEMYFRIVDGLTPGLEITCSAETRAFEFYRAEMELMLKSLRFDK